MDLERDARYPGADPGAGGREAFVRKLDALFAAGSEVKPGTYRGMIHEMNEMVAQNLGQYAHGNEPVHHVAYLYNDAGQPWKTQMRVRQIANQLYQSTPDGLAGDRERAGDHRLRGDHGCGRGQRHQRIERPVRGE